MAWQSPKTDWSSSDGVRNTDFNRIESNILYLFNNDAAREDVTLYVSLPSSSIGGGNGSDTTGDGSAAAPYATISKALSVLPKHLNGRSVTINVASGSYADDVDIRGFTGGMLTITGSLGTTVSLRSLTISFCTVMINGINLNITGAGGVTVTNGATLITMSDFTCTSAGVKVSMCSKAHFAGKVTVRQAYTAIDVYANSAVYIGQILGSNNTIGLSVTSGGQIAYNFNELIATTAAYTASGGRILTGAQ